MEPTAIQAVARRYFAQGDLAEAEHALLACCDVRADVVKVAHHGSRTSSTPALVDATAAALAVISVGRGNRFGLPDEDVLERWQASGAAVRRTDLDGAITVSIAPDGSATVTRAAR